MSEIKLSTPPDESAVRSLKAGDIVYLSGDIYTARDEAHLRALEYSKEGKEMPVDFSNSAVFHCGPIMQKENDSWHLVAAGPTTSARMNSLEPEFISTLKVRAIIGKGGMSKPTLDAMKEFGCVYLAITGGAALLAAKGIRNVRDVHWLDLGMPEALWILEGMDFGPLIVAMDCHGSSLFEKVNQNTENNIPKARMKLGLK
jgi:fumarate hydratase subunit beta